MQQQDNQRLSWMACELLVATRFADLCYGVSFPLWPQPYDLIVDKAGALYRVQVRLAGHRAQRVRPQGKGDRAHYRVDLVARSGRGRQRENIRTVAGAYDYLAAVCASDRIYIIPTAQLRCPTDQTQLIRTVIIKLPLDEGRRDSATAGLRWEPYLNRFDALGTT